MQCADLERYLEAYLDGRLGRTRAALLRRHLNHCGHCRQRVDELRQFEHDMQIRIQARQPAMSVWSGLDLDLVRTHVVPQGGMMPPTRFFQPPPHPTNLVNGLGIASRLPMQASPAKAHMASRRLMPKIIFAIVALATAGTMVMSAVRLFKAPPPIGSAAYRMIVETDEPLPLQSSDPVRLQHWLTSQSGLAIPALPLPAGFALAGARVERSDGQAHPVIVYRQAGKPLLLTLTPLPDAASARKPDMAPIFMHEDGFTKMTWRADGFIHEVISEASPSQLMPFDSNAPASLTPL
ncbi:Transmembrane transcriptional regulator (anti-sigma factor RsiW) [Arboricoccus pini]|uniref:Transmembrane transcriptional regulator (Anti-sigma factor RsiW) n=1 Tax=Arboricoccus pini TaxID=1963835 RepID=A0A212QQA9_9PROT|nr:zf-HC2 domain-containing protein [Arboricoccus pini]SNB61461.1 Transmembrane transcriptional regulator (anti-sigma factor RsiW) [Arboricoccus pini]